MTKIWAKRYTQGIISNLRQAGYVINKIPAGYVSEIVVSGKPIFRAMIGSRGYLVTYSEGLFS